MRAGATPRVAFRATLGSVGGAEIETALCFGGYVVDNYFALRVGPGVLSGLPISSAKIQAGP
jgi:hypothetical protein